MAHSALTLLLAVSFLVGGAQAAPPTDRGQALQALHHADAQVRRAAADRLGEVGEMADARALLPSLRDSDESTRARAEQAIWRIWGRSGDPQVDRLFRTGSEQMSAGELHKGIATFTRIIEIKPGFAEGWNKRATLYFLAGEYHKSLADCDAVLARNPYHFGALAGYGQIYLKLEDYGRALEYFRRALEVNPNMDGVKVQLFLLEKLIEEKRRNTV